MWKLATTVLLLPLVTMAFETRPGNATCRCRRSASLRPLLKRAFASDSPDLQPIPNPGPRDWLASHHEPAQTFDGFLSLQPIRPTSTRRVIYLQPLGEFPPEASPSIAKLCDFGAAFFAMEAKRFPRPGSALRSPRVAILTPVTHKSSPAMCSISSSHVCPRMHSASWRSPWRTLTPVHRGISCSVRRRRGNGSALTASRATTLPSTASRRRVITERSCCGGAARCLRTRPRTSSGLRTAFTFTRVMNGSNHLEESDARPNAPVPGVPAQTAVQHRLRCRVALPGTRRMLSEDGYRGRVGVDQPALEEA